MATLIESYIVAFRASQFEILKDVLAMRCRIGLILTAIQRYFRQFKGLTMAQYKG